MGIGDVFREVLVTWFWVLEYFNLFDPIHLILYLV